MTRISRGGAITPPVATNRICPCGFRARRGLPSVFAAALILLFVNVVGTSTFAQDRETSSDASTKLDGYNSAATNSSIGTERAAVPSVNIRKILVPADRLDKWPAGDWQPMSRRKFLETWKRLRAQEPEPQAVWIERAEYSAVFSGDSLRSGQGRWWIERQSGGPKFLEIVPMNLAVSEFQSGKDEAIWGATPSGGNVLFVADDRMTADFSWSLDGLSRRHSVVFDIEIPPATTSVLRLSLPDGIRLESSVGEITGPHSAEELDENRWDVNLGQATSCRLTLHNTFPPAAVRPDWMIRQQTLYIVRQEGAEIITDLNVETTSEKVDRIQIPVPTGVDIYSISYGNDTTVVWRVEPDTAAESDVLTISLPDPVSGPLRPIRISGFAQAIIDRDWELPIFRMPGLFLQGNIQLTIDPPLQLNTIETQGCRLQKTSTGTTTGTTYQLVQNDSAAGLSIQVAFPTVQLSAWVLHHLTHESSSWTWVAEMSLRSRSGSTYQVRNLLPVRWDIAEVQIAGPPSNAGQILKWTTEPASSEHQWLILDVAKAIDAEHPLSVRLRAKQTPGTAEDVLRFPFLKPQSCRLTEAVYAVHSPGQEAPREQLADGMQPTTVEEVGKHWSASPLLQSLKDNTQPARWYATSLNSGEGTQLEYPYFRQGLTGTATVEYDFLADRLMERYFVFVEPVSEPINRILVYVSGKGPDFEWEQLSDRVIPVEAQRLQADRHQTWNLPSKGELWEIRLPEATQDPIRLRAQRVRYHAGEVLAQLVFLPQSRAFRGTIELNSPSGIDVETRTTARTLQSRDVISQERVPDPAATISHWEYDDFTDSFDMRIKPSFDSGQISPAAKVQMQSHIFTDGTGESRHRVRFDLMGDLRSIEFVYDLPPRVSWIATRVNGKKVQPQYRGNQHIISLSRTLEDDESSVIDEHRIEVEYQETTGAIWLRDRVNVPLPRVEIPVVQFDWEINLPGDYFLESVPRGLNGIDVAAPFDWRSRWFGPMGRSTGEGGFNPLDSNDWRELYHRLRTDVAATKDEEDVAGAIGSSWQTFRLQGRQFPSSRALIIWNGGRLTWIGWLAFWGTLLIGGAVRVYTPRLLTGWAGIAWWSMLIAAVWFAPPSFSVVVGGVTFASLLIVLLPALWMKKAWFIERRLPRASGDSVADEASPITELRSGATSSATMTVLLVLCLAVQAGAQNQSGRAEVEPPNDEPNAAPTLPPNSADATWDVLFPFARDGEPTAQTDLVYIQSGQAKQLAAYASHMQFGGVDYVITSAEYLGRWKRDQPFLVEAKYRLAVFADPERPTTVVDLPIHHAHLVRDTACLVDGRPHAIFAVPERNGFTLEITTMPLRPIAPFLPEDAAVDGATALLGSRTVADARALASVQFREVTLFLHPVVRQQNKGEQFRIRVPPVSQSRLRLDFAEPPAAVQIVDRHGVDRTADSTPRSTIELGRQTELAVSWTWQPPTSVSTALSVTHQSLLEFSPTVVRGTSRVHHRVKSGVVRDVLWSVPAGVVVESVNRVGVDEPLSFDLFSTDENGRQLLIEFREPLSDDFSLEIDWLSHVTADGSGRISISPLAWLGRSIDESVDVKLDDVQAAVSGLAGYELLSSPDEHMILRDVPADEFYRVWGDEDATRRSGIISSFDPDGRIAFELRPLRSIRKARQDETFRFTRQRVLWTATIEVETSQTPALVHDMVLDPAIQLEDISVKQDEAERLSHFIRDGNRLKLILRDLTSSTQLISLSGFYSAMIGSATPLPRVQYQADVMDRSTFAIRHDNNIRLELLPDQKWSEVSYEQEVVSADAEWTSLGKFVRRPENAAAEALSVRMTVDAVRRPELSQVVALKAASGKSWLVRMLWHVDELHRSTESLRVELPDDIASPRIIAGPAAEITSADGEGGPAAVTFVPNESDAAGRILIVEGEWVLTGEGAWTVPPARVLGGDVTAHWLMISPRDAMRPREGDERQIPADIPLWSRPSLKAFYSGNMTRLYRNTEGAWTLAPVASREHQAQLTIPWMRSECRFDTVTGCSGRTEICVESAPGRVLRIDMPPPTQLVAILLNGSTLSAKVSERGELKVPLGTPNSSAAITIVDIVWQRPIDNSWGVLFHTDLRLPQTKNFRPEQHFVEIVSSPWQKRLAIAGISHMGDVEFHLELAELISLQIEALGESDRNGNLGLRKRLLSELAFLVERLEREPATFLRLPGMIARWRAVVDRHETELDELKNAPLVQSFWLSAAARSGNGAANDVVQGRRDAENTDSAVVLWWIDSRWYLGLLAVGAFGLTVFVLRKLTSWLGTLPVGMPAHLFAVLVTLIWWLFLEASILGLCLFLLALYYWGKHWNSADRHSVPRPVA